MLVPTALVEINSLSLLDLISDSLSVELSADVRKNGGLLLFLAIFAASSRLRSKTTCKHYYQVYALLNIRIRSQNYNFSDHQLLPTTLILDLMLDIIFWNLSPRAGGFGSTQSADKFSPIQTWVHIKFTTTDNKFLKVHQSMWWYNKPHLFTVYIKHQLIHLYKKLHIEI